jgi:hypothetical protein
MSDSDQQPFSPLTAQESRRSWAPMAAGASFLAVVIAVILLIARSGQSSSHTNENDPNLAKVQLSDLHMATADNFAGNSVTYIEGKIANNSDRKVTAVHVSIVFKNSLGETVQEEKALTLTVLLRSEPYVDYGPVDQTPLAPGQSRDFRLTLEHVSADWDGQLPQVKVISVGY